MHCSSLTALNERLFMSSTQRTRILIHVIVITSRLLLPAAEVAAILADDSGLSVPDPALSIPPVCVGVGIQTSPSVLPPSVLTSLPPYPSPVTGREHLGKQCGCECVDTGFQLTANAHIHYSMCSFCLQTSLHSSLMSSLVLNSRAFP